MKQKIKIVTNSNEIQCLYSQDWEYHDYGDCKRHLQILFSYKPEAKEEEKYPLILFIPGSAWHKQEMYNDIPQYALLTMNLREIMHMAARPIMIVRYWTLFKNSVKSVHLSLRYIRAFAKRNSTPKTAPFIKSMPFIVCIFTARPTSPSSRIPVSTDNHSVNSLS